MHGGDRIAKFLAAQGVRQLFTLCGGHISPILSAAKALGIRIVDVRDEATAVFAADASARLSGIPGFAAVTAGPGLTNTVTAIKNAELAQSPVVILGGAAPTVLKNKGALQDIDQMSLVAPLVKHAEAVRRVRDLVPAMARAFDAARDGVPGPVFVECPIDLLYDESVIRGWYSKAAPPGASLGARALRGYLHWHLGRQFAPGGRDPEPLPAPAVARAGRGRLDVAARTIAAAQKPVLLVGSQALLDAAAAGEIAGAVEQLGVPVYLSGMARGLLGPNHRLHLRHQRRNALKEADCVVLAGVPCDFRLDYGGHISRRARLISVNRSRHDLRMNRRPTLAIPADAGSFLRELAATGIASNPAHADWLKTLRERDDERERGIAAAAATRGEFVNPLRLLREIDAALDDDSIVVADGGDFVATASYTLRPRGPLSWLDPGVFGTLGVGAGFAIGAKLQRPGAETWIIYGDGAFGYSLIEFESLVRLGIPVIAVVGNDAGWTQIAREQIKLLGDDVGTVLARSDYHLAAEGLGAKGLLLDSPDRISEILLEAKAAARAGCPVLINALLDSTDFREGSISM
ncbi:MAG: thiamine pyrophosphate-binding protein [Gammaproteobacteria bacterium]|nr:thiamine pyrophosphate-binding protein [Gammaproteobacteria bacterium]MDH4254148.1 thiamine pyrophosphate-binding protein [Gammaproteobacteria bacterium]MDH5309485.1 thiamine pyrophosphate-binding protein [Gammaproteobacteria bacterium]